MGSLAGNERKIPAYMYADRNRRAPVSSDPGNYNEPGRAASTDGAARNMKSISSLGIKTATPRSGRLPVSPMAPFTT